jgi:hypothetical protein
MVGPLSKGFVPGGPEASGLLTSNSDVFYQNSQYTEFASIAGKNVQGSRGYSSSHWERSIDGLNGSNFESARLGHLKEGLLGKQGAVDRKLYRSQGKGKSLGCATYEEGSHPLGSHQMSNGYAADRRGGIRGQMQYDDGCQRPDSSYCEASSVDVSSSGLANIDSFGVATAPYVPVQQTSKVGTI